MRILLLAHSFNGLTQRLHAELAALGHALSVELDISDAVTIDAVARFGPDLVLAPFLKRAIPAEVHARVPCWIVHPGVAGDRGAFALDWAILRGEAEWGVTVLQATAEFDGGPILAEVRFPMRAAPKSSLYRGEVTDAAVQAVHVALARHGRKEPPVPQDRWPGLRGRPHPRLARADRVIRWATDDAAAVLRAIRAADGAPGVVDVLAGVPCRLFDAHPVTGDLPLPPGRPGETVARRGEAVAVRTRDGAIWIGHAMRLPAGDAAAPVADGAVPDAAVDPADRPFKLPATLAIGAVARDLPVVEGGPAQPCDPIRYAEHADGTVGWLDFAFHNGAMSTAQCRRLLAALREAAARPTRVLVLAGGPEFFSNGLHLNVIECDDSPAEASWDNINAIDDVAEVVLSLVDRLTVSAVRGNAGAGGVFLALAADRVWVREGVVLNPHYKNMGNLYGSEYWTYTLPRRLGAAAGAQLMAERTPLLATRAAAIGLVDAVVPGRGEALDAALRERAAALAASPDWAAQVRAKRERRAADEALRPLAAYRADELARMRRNFFGFDPSYHVARSNFVRKVAHSWTPRHLARHRDRPGSGTG